VPDRLNSIALNRAKYIFSILSKFSKLASYQSNLIKAIYGLTMIILIIFCVGFFQACHEISPNIVCACLIFDWHNIS